MARWRSTPARVEPPSWYRSFDLAMWDEPDHEEQAMIDGCPSMRPWPSWLREHHARRRWNQAKYQYARAHPQLQEQEFQDLQNWHRGRPRNPG